MAIKKNVRELIWLKYDKHCAYCGREIEYKQMQVDHIEAQWSTMSAEKCKQVGLKKGSNDLDNLNPACIRCNKWKSTFSINQFRKEIQLQLERLKRDSNQYRLAFDYGMIIENHEPIVFYFERWKEKILNK